MIALPFIYFLMFFVYIYRQRKFYSVSTFLIGIYMLISFGSILIDRLNAYSGICPKVDINLFSSILYCTLLTFCFIPFIKFHDEKIKEVKLCKKEYIISAIVYFYFILFVLFLVLVYKDLVRNMILLQINDNLKADFRFGREDVVSLTGFSLFLYHKIRIFSSSSMYLLFFFFYSISYLRKPVWYYFIILLGSSLCIVDSLLHLDRSAILYWFLEFMLCGIFFFRFLSKKKKRVISVILIFLLVIGFIYFIYINVSRFSDTNIGSDNQMVSYFGQSYINFCNFFQNLNLPDHSIVNTLPFTNYLIHPDFLSEDWYSYVQLKTGINIMVFSTFLGDIMSGVGLFWTIIYVFVFCFLSKLLLFRTNKTQIEVHQLFLFFILLNTVFLGIFTTFYHIWGRELCAIVIYILLCYSDKKRINN